MGGPQKLFSTGKQVVTLFDQYLVQSFTKCNVLTGWLCEGDPEHFAVVMKKIINDEVDLKMMGQAGHDRVVNKFSFEAFTNSLHEVALDTAALNIFEENREEGGTTLFTKFALAFHFSLAMMVLYWMVFATPLP